MKAQYLQRLVTVRAQYSKRITFVKVCASVGVVFSSACYARYRRTKEYPSLIIYIWDSIACDLAKESKGK